MKPVAITLLLCVAAFADWSVIPERDSLTLLLNGQVAGSLVTTTSIGDSTVTTVSHMKVSSPGLTPQAVAGMDLTEKRTYGLDGLLLHARQTLESDGGEARWELSREKSGQWQLSVKTGGSLTGRSVASVPDDLTPTRRLYEGLGNRTLLPGAEFTDNRLELVSGTAVTVTTTCVDTPSAANGGVWTFRNVNNVTGRSERWVIDTNGKTVELESWPFMARAKAGSAGIMTKPLFEALAVTVPRPPKKGESILLSFAREDSSASVSPDSSVLDFYRKKGSGWMLKPPPRPPRSCRSQKRYGFTDATPTMQADAPAIRRLADSLAGETDRRAVVEAMNRHVYQTLGKKYAPTFSNALETLAAGEGDCGEHAVLLGALLRAAGIPARIVLGLALQEKRYYYHAWVMVRVCEKWHFADPAFGMFPAPRDRIPLLVDDDGTAFIRLASAIGRIRIDYVR